MDANINEDKLRLVHAIYTKLPPYKVDEGELFVLISAASGLMEISKLALQMVELEKAMNNHQTLTLATIENYFANPDDSVAKENVCMLAISGMIIDMVITEHKAMRVKLDAMLLAFGKTVH